MGGIAKWMMEVLYQSPILILGVWGGGDETIKITVLFPVGADKPSTHLHLQFRRLADAVATVTVTLSK